MRAERLSSYRREAIYGERVAYQQQLCRDPELLTSLFAGAHGVFLNGGDQSLTRAAFIADERLKTIAQAAVAELHEGIQCKEGLICTGDQFMCDPERIARARTLFPTMAAVEMEGAAIAQVCHQFAAPFVITRSLSDIAGKESPDSFDAYLETASRHSSAMVVAMLKRM